MISGFQKLTETGRRPEEEDGNCENSIEHEEKWKDFGMVCSEKRQLRVNMIAILIYLKVCQIDV